MRADDAVSLEWVCQRILGDVSTEVVLLPCQQARPFYNPVAPEMELWLAVLQQAHRDYHSTPDSHRDHHTEAVLWMWAGRREVGEFLWICEAFNVAPGAIRRFIRETPVRKGKPWGKAATEDGRRRTTSRASRGARVPSDGYHPAPVPLAALGSSSGHNL